MSHFTVTVRITAVRLAKHNGDLDAALAEILAPYEESPGEESPFLSFNDHTEELREEYATKTSRKIKGPKGGLYDPWDERFRIPGTIGSGTDTHRVPQGYAEVEVPLKDLYPTFEQFVKKYHGEEFNAEGRCGYWHNTNAKWDWWSIGGRWTGFYPLKSGATPVLGRPGAFDNKPEKDHGDAVLVHDIDMDVVATKSRERLDKFWTEYTALLAGKEFRPFEGPRHRLIELGLLRVEQKTVEAGPGEKVFVWGKKSGDDRADWCDVVKVITRAELEEHEASFNVLQTYAALDDAGWHAAGEMGWFGCSDDTPEANAKYAREFMDLMIRAAGPDDVLVCVDCHI